MRPREALVIAEIRRHNRIGAVPVPKHNRPRRSLPTRVEIVNEMREIERLLHGDHEPLNARSGNRLGESDLEQRG